MHHILAIVIAMFVAIPIAEVVDISKQETIGGRFALFSSLLFFGINVAYMIYKLPTWNIMTNGLKDTDVEGMRESLEITIIMLGVFIFLVNVASIVLGFIYEDLHLFGIWCLFASAVGLHNIFLEAFCAIASLAIVLFPSSG